MNKPFVSSTRRDFLRWGTTATTGFCLGRALPLSASTAQITGDSTPLLSEFGYSQVDLGPGRMQEQFDENHRLLLGLDEDSLLLPFRIREGLPLKGSELGGWYSTYASAPACTFGQWVSALCRFYAATGDRRTRAKIDRLVRGWAATVEPEGKFYKNYKFPTYIYDKLVCMLLDAHVLAGQSGTFDALSRATDAALPYFPPHAIEMRKVINSSDYTEHALDESYTLPENLFLAWQVTGNARYCDLAQRFLFNREFFDPLANQENVLPGLHAYSHMNALSSAAMAYIALGDEKYLRAARNGFQYAQDQSFVTGGWGPHEHFIQPGRGELGKSLTKVHAGFETPCGSYAHFKICRYLMRVTRDSRYGDSMERVLYNTILGAKPIQSDGSAFYYSDYAPQTIKRVFYDKWPCCSGTLPLMAADYRISTYFRGPEGVYVNLYVPSTLHWQSQGRHFSIRQSTNYPYESYVDLTITASIATPFSIFLRIPEWANGASLTTNGMRATMKVTPGTFAEVHRNWRTGDRIELDLPLVTRLEPVDPEHPDTVGVLTGPLALLAINNMPPFPHYKKDSIFAYDPVAKSPQPVSRASLLAVSPVTRGAHEWTSGAGASEMRLRPFLDIETQTYTTYQQVLAAHEQ
jgi:DUF1680 family protein